MADLGPKPEPAAAASELVAACEDAWRAIQNQHSGVPDVVVILGSGVERGRLVKLGHWWGGRWIADGELRGEVLLAGEALHFRPEQVFEVLLHEAAHGLNAARGVKDASRGGRYHNARFKGSAEELGLIVESAPPFGWAQTSLGAEASSRYAREVARLGEAMRIARRLGADVRLGDVDAADQGSREQEGGSEAGDGESSKAGPAVCGCGRKMRMAPSVLAKGPVQCGLCGQDFSTDRQAERARRGAQAFEPTHARAAPNWREGNAAVAGGERARVSAVDVDAPTDHERSSLLLLSELASSSSGLTLIAEVGAWREARGRDDPRPLVAASLEGVDRANDVARALLKLDGELTGDVIVVTRRELSVGESVVVGDHTDRLFDVDGLELPPSGVLGTVVAIDGSRDLFDVEFAVAGRYRLAAASPAAAALVYGYAERAGYVGAPLIDLRTLPEVASMPTHDLREVPEPSW